MRIVFILFIIVIAFCKGANCQDSAEIFFIKQNVSLKTGKINQLGYKLDSNFSEILIEINTDKYFYVKERHRDTLPIVFGQLRLYNFGGKYYLLREGYWVLENSSEKILFHNYGRLGLFEEMKVPIDKSGYSTQTKYRKKKLKKRTNK